MQRIPDQGLWLGALALAGVLVAAPSPHEPAAPGSAPAATNSGPACATLSTQAVNLEFSEFFRSPAGPRGLEFTERARALEGRRVQLRGFMIRQEDPVPHCFLFAARPVQLHEHEYGFADELPPTTVHVFTDPGTPERIPFTPGPLCLTGILSLGARPEPDGRVSLIRLSLDPPTPDQRLRLEQAARLAPTPPPTPHVHEAHEPPHRH